MRKIKDLLLVEDSEIDSWIAMKIIELADFCSLVMSAGDGIEAFEKIEVHASRYGCLPELILVDLNLPIMNGFEIIQLIMGHSLYSENKTRIVLMTEGLDVDVDLPQVRKLGIKYLLLKPLSIEKLRDVLL